MIFTDSCNKKYIDINQKKSAEIIPTNISGDIKSKLEKSEIVLIGSLGDTSCVGNCVSQVSVDKVLRGSLLDKNKLLVVYIPTDFTHSGPDIRSCKFLFFISKKVEVKNKTFYNNKEIRFLVGEKHLDYQGLEIANEENISIVERLIKDGE